MLPQLHTPGRIQPASATPEEQKKGALRAFYGEFRRHEPLKNVGLEKTAASVVGRNPPPPLSHGIRLFLGGLLSSVARFRFAGHAALYWLWD